MGDCRESIDSSSSEPDRQITSEDVERGYILWLGSLEDLMQCSSHRWGRKGHPVTNVVTGVPANNGMLSHPILVLSRPAEDPSMIQFLPLTSLNNQCVGDRFQGRKSSWHQNTFVPIIPAEPHPKWEVSGNWKYQTLTFDDGEQLKRPTYVNIRELYQMKWQLAELYWGGDPDRKKSWKIDAASLDRVTLLASRHAGYKAVRQYGEPPRAPTRRRTMNDVFDSRCNTEVFPASIKNRISFASAPNILKRASNGFGNNATKRSVTNSPIMPTPGHLPSSRFRPISPTEYGTNNSARRTPQDGRTPPCPRVVGNLRRTDSFFDMPLPCTTARPPRQGIEETEEEAEEGGEGEEGEGEERSDDANHITRRFSDT